MNNNDNQSLPEFDMDQFGFANNADSDDTADETKSSSADFAVSAPLTANTQLVTDHTAAQVSADTVKGDENAAADNRADHCAEYDKVPADVTGRDCKGFSLPAQGVEGKKNKPFVDAASVANVQYDQNLSKTTDGLSFGNTAVLNNTDELPFGTFDSISQEANRQPERIDDFMAENQKAAKNAVDIPFRQQNAVDIPFRQQNAVDIPFRQQLENLPTELLAQPRFIPVDQDKVPILKDWSNPDKQRRYNEIKGLVGFDTSGRGVAADYLLVDFDHVINDNGNFVNAEAENWYKRLSEMAATFCELSISKHGLHFFLKPSPDKFSPVANGKAGVLHFGEGCGGAAKIELFYKTKGRYCLVTGDCFGCQPQTPICSGETADAAFKVILDAIKVQIDKQMPSKPARSKDKSVALNFVDAPDYDLFRAQRMLDAINPADLGDTDWLAVISACKNIGVDYSSVDDFNARDPQRYDESKNLSRWDSVTDPSFDIQTLHGIAQRFGYNEAQTRKEYFGEHNNSAQVLTKKAIADETQKELVDALKWLDTLTVDTFTAADVRQVALRRVALCQEFGDVDSGKYFAIIKDAKKIAAEKLKESESGLTEKLADAERYKLTGIADGINVNSVHRSLDRELTDVRRENRERLKAEAAKADAQRRKERREQRAAQVKSDSERLVELKKQPPSPERDSEIREILRGIAEWQRDRDGNPTYIKATAKNIKLFLENDPCLDGLVAYDEFQQVHVLKKAPSWRPNAKIGSEWTDDDDSQLRYFLRDHYGEFSNRDLTYDALVVFSRRNAFHEVKDFFRNLPTWDGVKRAETFFVKFLKADDTPYTREITLNWLTAAVARIFNPGCDYQTAPILLGDQGIGKSYSLSRLGGKWYGNLVDDVSDSHAIDAIQKMWLVEIKEMAAMKKDVDANKRFIDAARDTRRFAYGRRATTVQRNCVFVITTNNEMCLTDLTGNRRYPVIRCHATTGTFVEGLTTDYVNQIWAEVYRHYNEIFKDGFDEAKLLLSKATREEVNIVAEKYTRDDFGEDLRTFLDLKILPQIIWKLLTKEERRKFLADGKISIEADDLEHRFRNSTGRRATEFRADFDDACKVSNTVRHEYFKNKLGNVVWHLTFYGTELRQHICPAEILTECFDKSDRRRPTAPRILETLRRMPGWYEGERLARADPQYRDQKRVFYRVTIK